MSLNCIKANCIAAINCCIKHKAFYGKCHYSKLAINILEKLKQYKIIHSYVVLKEKLPHKIQFKLNIMQDQFLIDQITIISTPGSTVYKSYKDLKQFLSRFDNILVSTDHGILNYSECLSKKVGGEVLLGYK